MNSKAKQHCPFVEKCYCKDPIHFKEMSHPHLEKLLINQLDGIIKIPKDLHFTCDDRTQLMDQLIILQMVLRKERDKNEAYLFPLLPATSTSSSKTESLSTVVDSKEDFKQKMEKYKKIIAQRRKDKLEQMNAEATAPSRAIREKDQEPSSSSVTEISLERMKQISLESNDKEDISDSQQDSGSQISSTSDANSYAFFIYMLMDMYQVCNSEESWKKVRQIATSIIRQSFVKPGEFAMKYALSEPYHLFFTRVEQSKETYDQQFSVTFPEILDRSLGEIVSSLHLNFMVDVGWLCLQYLLAGQRTDMLILYGSRQDDLDHEKLGSNITVTNVEMSSEFGCHHSKIMILQYKDNGIRVVVSTANLYSGDWENRTQGLWISPHLPLLPESANPSVGESLTGFKKDLVRYLNKYGYPSLTQWIWTVRRADFSSVNVFFVASVPGIHKDIEANLWGHRRLAYILLRHAKLPPDASQWPIIAQSSSVGSFGPNFKGWLSKEIIASMSKGTKDVKSRPNFQFIYPSIENYKQSYDRQNWCAPLPYSQELHSKQEWIESYLCQWRAVRTGRDRAMPHIKSYTRISPDLKRIPWFVLTSANLSKAAWGVYRGDYSILSYEAGVIFIPKFITKTTTFPIKEEEPFVPVFPIPYDLPLSPYDSSDKPFVVEFLHALAEESFG